MELQAKVYTRTNDNGTHYARIVVPKELRVFASKPALWRSLATKSNKEAVMTGTLVAAASQLVFQEVSDSYMDAAVVNVVTEIVSNEIDLSSALDKIDTEDLEIVAASLKKTLDIRIGDSDDNDTESGRSTRTSIPESSRKSKSSQNANSAIEREMITDHEVAHYLEKRPHGVYRFRFWIPRSLQKLFGEREVRKTLKTADRMEAIGKARPILLRVYRRISVLDKVGCTV